MNISIIIPVLNSHEILRRQLLYMESFITDDTEIIIVDDGSSPPLEYTGKLPVRIIRTNDTRPWTWALARNKGAKEAKGEWLFMFDIDHIIDKSCIDIIRGYTGDKIQYKREYGVLTDKGEFTQDLETLVSYGFLRERYRRKRLTMTPLPNNFAIRKEVFFKIGGYREDLVERPYPQGEDRRFKKSWCVYEREQGGIMHPDRTTIYMIPNGYKCGNQHVDFNPFGLFHDLTRATRHNHWHRPNITPKDGGGK